MLPNKRRWPVLLMVAALGSGVQSAGRTRIEEGWIKKTNQPRAWFCCLQEVLSSIIVISLRKEEMGRGDCRGSGNEMLRFCMPLSLRLQLVFSLVRVSSSPDNMQALWNTGKGQRTGVSWRKIRERKEEREKHNLAPWKGAFWGAWLWNCTELLSAWVSYAFPRKNI